MLMLGHRFRSAPRIGPIVKAGGFPSWQAKPRRERALRRRRNGNHDAAIGGLVPSFQCRLECVAVALDGSADRQDATHSPHYSGGCTSSAARNLRKSCKPPPRQGNLPCARDRRPRRTSGSFPRLERKWFHVAEDKRDSFGVVYIPRSLK